MANAVDKSQKTITISDLIHGLEAEDLIKILADDEDRLIAGATIDAMLGCYYGLSLESKIVVNQEEI